MNIDECTASNTTKVLSSLASYFDDEFGRSVVQHYKSRECIYVDTEVLISKIWNVFSEESTRELFSKS